RVRSDEISDFRTGQQREVAAGDRVTEVQLTELGCMNKGDEHGSKQKGLVLQRGPHGATPLLASAVGTESLRYDHLTVRAGSRGSVAASFAAAMTTATKSIAVRTTFISASLI